jgi:acyl dehydratase
MEMAVPDEVMRMVGIVSEPVMCKVEEGAIERFADAVDDPNPLYRDAEYAKRSRYGGIIAPLGFFGWPLKGKTIEGDLNFREVIAKHMALTQGLDGGSEYGYFLPVRAGDTLTAYTKMADIVEREGRDGRTMVFVTRAIRYLNQNGDLVAIAKVTTIMR